MKKIFLGLMLVASLATAKIDVIEATSQTVNAMTRKDKISIQKVCVDHILFLIVVSSTGISITQIFENQKYVFCENGK